MIHFSGSYENQVIKYCRSFIIIVLIQPKLALKNRLETGLSTRLFGPRSRHLFSSLKRDQDLPIFHRDKTETSELQPETKTLRNPNWHRPRHISFFSTCPRQFMISTFLWHFNILNCNITSYMKQLIQCTCTMYISSMFLSVMKLWNFRNRNAYLSGSIRWTNAGVGTNMNPVEMQVLDLYCFCVPLMFRLSFRRYILELRSYWKRGTGTAFWTVPAQFHHWFLGAIHILRTQIKPDFDPPPCCTLYIFIPPYAYVRMSLAPPPPRLFIS